MNKLISYFVILLFVFTMLVACSSNSSGDANSSADKTADSGAAEDRPTIKLYTNEHPSWPTNEDWIVWDIIEDEVNMDLELTIAAEPYGESLNLVIASGDLPDIMRMTNYGTPNEYGADGALVNLLDHIDKMPNLQAWMEQFPDEARRALSHDGKMYVSPNTGIGETNRMLWMYRQDVFEEHGLKTPNNWDELYKVLQELKSIYPESYPFGFRNGTDKLVNFASNFGTNWDYYYDEAKDEWRYGPMEESYRGMIEYFNKFYQEKLIPPDFLSTDTAGWQELISTDTSFITQDYIGRIDEFNITNRESNPDYTIKHMAPPAGSPGEEQLNYSAHTNDGGFSVAVNSKHIDKAIEFIDWTFSEDGRGKLSWGIEGETYTEENGEKKWMKDYTSPAELRIDTGLSTYSTYSWFDYDAHMILFSDDVKQAYEESPQYDAPIVPVPSFTPEEQEIMAIKGEAIKKHRDQEIAKFIIGKRDLGEWDAYVKEIEDLGVQELIEIYEGAYKRMQEVELN
ncbi:putative aldouronate transport system substrate-binding protein [Lederbergia galactosidilyticus]|uniref:extracellular solute-binding protein n=1 Tax=Lederbergia galactosidilytica TaxID=217031 RepID=UPI001AE1C80B|nr:extracellular solute-binding protein [Lederbergia galactosidilytica]MBP1913211.1 putative aldouronate transport system substrate-binding protein [Lederbergia galactosidilytica]